MTVFKTTLFLITIPFLAWGLEINESDSKVISLNYVSGPYLIYQCQNKHFACISKFNYESCVERRETAIRLKMRTLPCAPLRVFENVDECLKWFYGEIHRPRDLDSLCTLDAFEH